MELHTHGHPGARAGLPASVGFPACGADDADKQPAATPKKVAVTATEAAEQSRLSVPTSVPAGLVTFELTNTGTA